MADHDTARSDRAILSDSHFLATLDGWRAIAICAVIVCHIAVLYSDASPLVHLGAQGVALFFAISGFLITTRLLMEVEAYGGISLQRFYIRRACRILPPAFLYLATLAVLDSVHVIALRPYELWSAALFFNNYWPERSWFTAHFWSLSIEEHFYLMWPAILSVLGARKVRLFAIGVIAVTLVWRPLGGSLIPAVPAIERTDMRLDAFMYACLLAIVVRDRSLEPALRRLLAKSWMPATIIAALAFSYLMAAIFGIRLLKEFSQAALMPLLIGTTVLAPQRGLGRFLETAPLRYVGRISYGLYLWQELFLTRSLPFGVAVKLGLTVAVAAVTYRYYDQKWMAVGRKASTHFARKVRTAVGVS